MARALACCALVLASAIPLSAQQGPITLRGDQIYDEQGQPFFPMIMNYYVDYAWAGTAPPDEHPTTAQLANCHLSRSSSYTYQGAFNYSDPAQGQQKIYQDLFEMKLLGFNTIRLIMTPTKQQGTGFSITVKKFLEPGSGQADGFIRLDPPYDPVTNIVANFHFNNVLAVCSLAASLDMKVMLIPADSPKSYPELIRGNVGDTQIADGGDFFTALAAFLHDHGVTNILAYDLLNEPSLAEDKIKTLAGGDYQAMHTKAQVCDLVQYFADRIRQVDPGRLITIGIYISRDPFRGGWDPLLNAADFATVHLYPDLTEREFAIDPAMAKQRAIDRYNDQIYIADRTIRKPFMMAETSFSAHNNDGGNHFYFPMSVHGSEADQADFVAQTFPAIRDSRACGYAWWDFEDKHWFSDPYHLSDPDQHSFNSYKEDFFGLHVWCNPAEPDYANGISGYEAYRKDAADLFAGWVADTTQGLLVRDSLGIVRPTMNAALRELLIPVGNGPEPCTGGEGDGVPYWRVYGNDFEYLCDEDPLPWLGTASNHYLSLRTNGTERMVITTTGKVGIGTIPPGGAVGNYRLYVESGISTRDVLVKHGTWPDFVFDEDYALIPLGELRHYLARHRHLPGMPSASEVLDKGGVEVGDMQHRLLQVVEEQALYILQLEEKQRQLEARLEALETLQR